MHVESSGVLGRCLIEKMKGLKQEHLDVIFLDTKNFVIGEQTIFVGSLNSAPVHPREIFHAAVEISAAHIILVHNHPSGNENPSQNDRQLTKRIKECGLMMEIDLLDHIIIGNGYYSFAEKREL